MSIGGMLRTSVSGMNAQSVRLSAVSENIANSNTNGYKQAQVQFETMLVASAGEYQPGTVAARDRRLVSEQGAVTSTGNNVDSKAVDLAVAGDGFFVVTDRSGGYFLTRAGSFTRQADGTLVNTAGYTLVGYPPSATGTGQTLNSFAGLEVVNLQAAVLNASPTTSGTLTVPLDQTFVSGTRGTYTQAAAFNMSAATPSATGDTVSFDITIDGTTRSVTVNTPTGGIANLTASQVVSAINARSGLDGVASLDSTGRLVLTANGRNTGSTSVITMSAPVVKDATNTTKTVTGMMGLDAGSQAGGPVFDPATNGPGTPSKDSTITKSITVYTNSGEAVKLDVYYTKVAENEWSMGVFDSRTASTTSGTKPFPYATDALTTATLVFDAEKFTLSDIRNVAGGSASVSADNKSLNLDLTSIGGSGTVAVDMTNQTQFAGTSQALAAAFNGNPAEVVDKIKVSEDGTVTAIFGSGSMRELYKIPLAKVESPNSLTSVSGNAFQVGVESGTVLIGSGGSAGFGSIQHGALEESTVDLASELTVMIESQRSYTANSKVFQTGSEILDVLVNLKR